MKLLRSPWIISLLALVINLGVVTGTLFVNKTTLVEAAQAAIAAAQPEEVSQLDPEYWSLQFEGFAKMLEALEVREQAVAAEEQRLRELASSLATERSQLEEIRHSLRQDRDALREALVQVGAEEGTNLRFLASTFAEMPPDQVVPVVGAMTDEQAVKIFLQMKPDTVAPIFSAMVANDNAEGRNARRVAFFSQEIRRFQRTPISSKEN